VNWHMDGAAYTVCLGVCSFGATHGGWFLVYRPRPPYECEVRNDLLELAEYFRRLEEDARRRSEPVEES